MKKKELNTTVMHHLFLWVYNWKEDDFKSAFATSDLGWEYQWNKFQQNLKSGKCASSAIIATVLNMDNKHQQLLLDYIIGNKYKDSIKSMIANIAWMQEIESEANDACLHNNTSISDDNYVVCNDCGAYLKEL